MKAQGLSQNQLAARAKITASDLSKIINRRMVPYASQLRKLAIALGHEGDDAGQLMEELPDDIVIPASTAVLNADQAHLLLSLARLAPGASVVEIGRAAGQPVAVTDIRPLVASGLAREVGSGDPQQTGFAVTAQGLAVADLLVRPLAAI
jgi:transcriptional regulator with XRE-family HTH domain